MPSHFRRTVALAAIAGGAALAVTTPPLLLARGTPPAVRPPGAREVVFAGAVRDGAGAPLGGAVVLLVGSKDGASTDARGRFAFRAAGVAEGARVHLVARRIGYAQEMRDVVVRGDTVRADFRLEASTLQLSEVVATGAPPARGLRQRIRDALADAPPAPSAPAAARVTMGIAGGVAKARMPLARGRARADGADGGVFRRQPLDTTAYDREGYDRIEDNPFLAVAGNPRSTFSIDVDRASYGNVRRFLAQGQRPPADAVRIEELVNYFPYALPAPRGDDPLSITTEVMPAPWRARHQLVRVALQARPIETAALPPSNLVFLVDVSGSMMDPDKLPLVKQALALLVAQLRPEDRVALVAYAGAAGLILPPTSGRDKPRIMEAIERLEAGGSTAGGEGLLLAYKVAREARAASGGATNTRVVLATDGDFNVGVSSDAALERLIEEQRASGTYLTVLGFGTGNYQDAKMEKLAKRGNGNYAYVDDLAEARKVLVHELGATLHVVAQDVKLQVEFNPAAVRAYRLIGYEDRLLRDEDFADDRKDAGDVGAGHSVTALYEIVPAGVEGTVAVRGADPLRYAEAPRTAAGPRDELLYVQLRYKRPGESTSRLMRHPVRAGDAVRTVAAASADFRFASAVASFGMQLRDSEHKGDATPASVLALARGALGRDADGYRAEFVRMVERWRSLEAVVVR